MHSYFNIYNKQVLKAFPHPLTVTSVQFAVGSVIACGMWALGLHKRPESGLEAVRGGPGWLLVLPLPLPGAAVGGIAMLVCSLCGPQAVQVKSVSPLAVVHTLGNSLTNISLGAVAVSFTHTIKALEPFFSGERGGMAGP